MSDYTVCPRCEDTRITWEEYARFGYCGRCDGILHNGDPEYFTTRPARLGLEAL